jgi:hypothetical protein
MGICWVTLWAAAVTLFLVGVVEKRPSGGVAGAGYDLGRGGCDHLQDQDMVERSHWGHGHALPHRRGRETTLRGRGRGRP